MYIHFILVFLFFIFCFFTIRWLVSINPRVLAASLKWSILFLLVVLSVFLVITGRLGAAISFLIGGIIFGWRLLNFLPLLSKVFNFINMAKVSNGRASSKEARSSEVRSKSLCMTLDHDTGKIDGYITTGKLSNQALSGLDISILLGFRNEIIGQTDCVALLETYLDQRFSEWRDGSFENHGPSSDGASSTLFNQMTEAEARRILGVESKSDKKAVKQAYRNLISKMHPDVGGSEYLTAKINQAKDILMKIAD